MPRAPSDPACPLTILTHLQCGRCTQKTLLGPPWNTRTGLSPGGPTLACATCPAGPGLLPGPEQTACSTRPPEAALPPQPLPILHGPCKRHLLRKASPPCQILCPPLCPTVPLQCHYLAEPVSPIRLLAPGGPWCLSQRLQLLSDSCGRKKWSGGWISQETFYPGRLLPVPLPCLTHLSLLSLSHEDNHSPCKPPLFHMPRDCPGHPAHLQFCLESELQKTLSVRKLCCQLNSFKKVTT